MKKILQHLGNLLEAVPLAVLVLFFRLLPMDMASSLGGRLGRIIGPFTRAHSIADINLKHVFPHFSEEKRQRILVGMWDNLGRIAGECPHLSLRLVKNRITVEGGEYLDQARDAKAGAIFISAHFSNWEMAPITGLAHKLPMKFIYRPANNPYTDKLIQWMRRDFRHFMYEKGRGGMPQIVKSRKKGECPSLLVDQKLNEGVPVSFMGYTAMRGISVPRMAINYQVPIYFMRVMRTDGAHFHVTVSPPVYYPPDADPVEAMESIHRVMEGWILEHPEQWFWVHKRWKWNEIKN